MGERTKCKERVTDSTGFHSFQCRNGAKYGDYCGVHSPEKQAERAKKRGPSQWELECAARDKERQRVSDMEAELEAAEAEVERLRGQNRRVVDEAVLLRARIYEIRELEDRAEAAEARVAELEKVVERHSEKIERMAQLQTDKTLRANTLWLKENARAEAAEARVSGLSDAAAPCQRNMEAAEAELQRWKDNDPYMTGRYDKIARERDELRAEVERLKARLDDRGFVSRNYHYSMEEALTKKVVASEALAERREAVLVKADTLAATCTAFVGKATDQITLMFSRTTLDRYRKARAAPNEAPTNPEPFTAGDEPTDGESAGEDRG